MGAALEASGRDIVYSCSWPAYINNKNDSLQPFGTFIMDGCNLWRNYYDIQCHWASLEDIIDHWGMCVRYNGVCCLLCPITSAKYASPPFCLPPSPLTHTRTRTHARTHTHTHTHQHTRQHTHTRTQTHTHPRTL